MGTIRVKLYKDTPKHRDNFARLAITRYYDGLLFHRVIDGFMVQGGDPYTRDTSRVEEWGEGGPGYTIDAEILPEHRHKKGALAAARRGNLANPMRESSGSQFYLVQDSTNCKHLNGEYTVFGETIGGLNVIDRIARVQTDGPARPSRRHPAHPPERADEQAGPGRGAARPGGSRESDGAGSGQEGEHQPRRGNPAGCPDRAEGFLHPRRPEAQAPGKQKIEIISRELDLWHSIRNRNSRIVFS